MSVEPKRGRSLVLRGVALALVASIVALGATGCEPRASRKDRTILFVHGWQAFGSGTDCKGTFGALEANLKAQGFTGKMITVGYYDSDTNCDVNLRNWGSIDNSTSWKDLGKAFSKYVHDTFSAKNQPVDVVSHSMGGLIVRGAVQGAQAKDSGFSQPLMVEDVATLAAPFAGAAWYSNLCLWGQCAGLKPGASDIKWLATNPNPQGSGGTEWTAFGSTNDDVVPWDSALSIGVPDAQKVKYSSLEHSDYMGNGTCQARVGGALADAGV